MPRDSATIRARLVRAALAAAPGSWNPAWRYGDIIRAELEPAARIAVDPRQVLGKLGTRTMAGLKQRFVVPLRSSRELRPIAELPTYRDVEDFAAHGDDYRSTRLYRWLKQSAEEGMPVNARGVLCDTEQRILDYYFTYLELFRSLQQHGYAYRGDDEICFGITADGGIVHMRRGTHRLASAHFLGLPFVTGMVTHADPAWVEQACRRNRGGPLEAIALSLRPFQGQGQSQAAAQ
ncbi:hypothetical protein [Dongia deserti]|uniref:hypothetical protein n=1 Tax=Dongia deserti TaxID=2268030 RepID=UPI0013C47AAB|nr:hypothetical protein [Dongia deserti]